MPPHTQILVRSIWFYGAFKYEQWCLNAISLTCSCNNKWDPMYIHSIGGGHGEKMNVLFRLHSWFWCWDHFGEMGSGSITFLWPTPAHVSGYAPHVSLCQGLSFVERQFELCTHTQTRTRRSTHTSDPVQSDRTPVMDQRVCLWLCT